MSPTYDSTSTAIAELARFDRLTPSPTGAEYEFKLSLCKTVVTTFTRISRAGYGSGTLEYYDSNP